MYMNNTQGTNNQTNNTYNNTNTPINNGVQTTNTYNNTSTPINNGVQTTNMYNNTSTPVNNGVQPTNMYNNTSTPVNNGVQPTNMYNNTSTPVNNGIPQYGQPINNGFNNQYYNNGQYGNYYNPNNFYPQPKKKSNGCLIFLILFVVIGIVFILLFSLSNSDSRVKYDPDRVIDYERTVMIYMVGADLESRSGLATQDLNGLDYNQLNQQKTKVLLIAGGSLSWKNNYISANETSIYELTENGFVKVKQQTKKNMGESSLLSEFLNYGYKNYSSKKYDLVFWNHGMGVLGSEADEISSDYLSLSEIQLGLKNSVFSDEHKLELIFFRTCLNGTIEVADIVKDYSEYLVASQEVTLGYTGNSILKVFNTITPSDDGLSASKKIVNGYANYIETYITTFNVPKKSVYVTYSVIDLANISQLESSLESFFADINNKTNFNTVGRVRGSLLQYGESDPTYDSVDLYNLVDKLKLLSPSKAEQVLNNLNKVIVYNYSTDNNSKGLSIYFPYNGENEKKKIIIDSYYNFNNLNSYKLFISQFNNYQSNANFGLDFSANKFSVSKNNNNADFTLELTDEQKDKFVRASYIVFRSNNDGYYLPVYSSKSTKLEGNILKASIKDRQLKVVSTLDNSESIITLVEESEDDDYIKYSSIVTLEDFKDEDMRNWKYDTGQMSLILNKKTSQVTIGDVKLKSKKNDSDVAQLPYTAVANINDYTNFVFGSSKYKILDENGNYIENWESNGIFEGYEEKVDKIKFELEDFDDNYDYYCIFKIWDTANNSYYSKLIKMN